MTDTPPPAWAMQKARDLDNVGCGCHSDEEAAKCEFMAAFCQRSRYAIARAFAAERAETEARAERETIERCAKVAGEIGVLYWQ